MFFKKENFWRKEKEHRLNFQVEFGDSCVSSTVMRYNPIDLSCF
jgi:hypothetical protein